MNSDRPTDQTQRLLVLIKQDSSRLFERIKSRQAEYLYVFSVKRTREHFKDVFKNRFEALSIQELCTCSEEVIVASDAFYAAVDDLRWYLNHTENMPGTVEENVQTATRKISKLYEVLSMSIDADLGLIDRSILNDYQESSESEQEVEIEQSTPNIEIPSELEEESWGDQGS